MTKKRKENTLLGRNDKIQVGGGEVGLFGSADLLTAGDEHLRAEGAAAGRGGQAQSAGGEGHGED